MRLAPTLGCSLTTLLLAQLATAAPVISPALDVAPRFSVEATHTTERARAIAAGAGKIVVVWALANGEKGVPGARFFDAELAAAEEPIDAPFAESSVAFDGESFVFAGDGGGFQRYRPDGTKLDLAPIFPSGVKLAGASSPAVACRAINACALVFSAKAPGADADAGVDVFFASFDDGVAGVPVRLTTAKRDQSLPQIVWDGTNWIAVWNDRRFVTGGSFEGTGLQLFGARISATGQLLDPIGKALTTYEELLDAPNDPTFTTAMPSYLGLFRHGGATWLAWQGKISGQIVARRFDGAFVSQDTQPRVILGGKQGSPWSIASQDAELAVFTTIKGSGQPQEIQLVRVPDGAAASAPTTTGLGFESVPTAMPGGGYAVAKTLFGTPVPGLNSTFDTWVSRVSAAGVTTKSAYASAVPTVVEGRAFAYGPSFGVVAYSDNRGGTNSATSPRKVYVAALAGAESVTPAEGTYLADDVTSGGAFPLFDAAASPGVALVVWNQGAKGAQDVLGAFVDASGNIVKQITIAGEPYDETSAHVAFDGTNFVVGWLDAGNGYDVPVYRRFAPDGTSVDAAFTLLVPSLTESATLRGVACDLAGACVATIGTDYAPFTGTTVGAAKDSDDIDLFANVNQPSIAGGDAAFVFLLASQQTGTSSLAQRVGTDLVATDKNQLTVLGDVSASSATRADAGWNGQRFVFGRVSDKILEVGSLAASGPASKPVVIATNIRPQPVPWTDDAKGLRAPLQIGGAQGRTIVAYPDNGRYWVRGIDDIADEGGNGGTGGTSGTGGNAPTGGTGGTAGKGGTGATGGTAGKGGSGGLAGKGGSGGTAGKGGSTSKGGSSGKGGSDIGEGGSDAGEGGSDAGEGGSDAGSGGNDAGKGGKGGATSGSAGTASNAAANSGDDGGCGCRIEAGGADEPNAVWGFLGVLGLGVVMARRRSAPRGR